jgi:predicted CoA-substrate-specific enzyme activase
MISLGIDLGASTLKLTVLQDGNVRQKWMGVHHGKLAECLGRALRSLDVNEDERLAICVTGSNAERLLSCCPDIEKLGDIPAVVEGVRRLLPEAGCVIEIGSQGARFITGLQDAVPQFSVNEHCAGGTGSFFEDQMSRLGCRLDEYSELVRRSGSIPRLSGRCAVFAKTDIIHRQQEGASIPDILLGLCYAMIRNYKATIVQRLPVVKPVVFCGGVTKNAGVVRAIREIFELTEDELIVPEDACFEASLGAALRAENTGHKNAGQYSIRELLEKLQEEQRGARTSGELPALRLREGTNLSEPSAAGVIPEGGCALGIDIGSTSTDLVLIGRDGTLVDFQYLRTAGDPEGAVRKGLAGIRERFGDVWFAAVGVTGSGRERIGKRIGADAIRDEITAQAKGAVHWVPEADTVFEIGGQDSKYISIRNGEVVDFQMNKICAAGTGSFVEEQAARMNIPIAEFGTLALEAQHPAYLGERCTVFIETAIASAAAEGVSQSEIAAGLCHSIVQNYLHKVVGSKPVGHHIVLQGGVNYNPGIVAAFQAAYGDRIRVNPCFSISGAFGAALLAMEEVGDGVSRFVGFDSPAQREDDLRSAEIQKNIAFYREADRLLLEGYTGRRDPGKKTVGIPFVLMIHKFFPMAHAFFTSLGYNVLLTDPTSEETIRLSQQLAQGETCYPVKLIYGHMQQLIDQKVDYIFLPTIHTMKHEKSRVKHNYGCVYMQTAAVSVAKALEIEKHGIQLLSPVFDLDFGQEAMAGAMVGLGKILGIPKPFCAKALLSGAMAVRRHTVAVEKQGKALLEELRPTDKVLVLITRNYGVSDPILNMGIPELLLERGYKVITLNHLPGHSLDIADEYDNLYYPFGQHILSGAKLIAAHPNLYAVYLTNHGCGPDTMLAHLFRREMGDKPYLQIEVDEHFSNVGVITRIEAFLNSLRQRPAVNVPKIPDPAAVRIRPCPSRHQPEKGIPLYIPALGEYTPYLVHYYQELGASASVLPHLSRHALGLGRAETSAKEYLPFAALLGSILEQSTKDRRIGSGQFLIPQNQGAEADGLYARVIRAVLDRGEERAKCSEEYCRGNVQSTGLEDGETLHGGNLISPVLETLPVKAENPDALFRALLAGDLIYAAPPDDRGILRERWTRIPSWEQLHEAAQRIGREENKRAGRRLAVVGTPLCLTELDSGVLTALEGEGEHILRAPLGEAMWFLWQDNMDMNESAGEWMKKMAAQMQSIGRELGARSAFAGDLSELIEIAEGALPRFAGANGRYRYAKAAEMSRRTQAVLTLAPRYENTAMILEMRGMKEACRAPLFELSLDNDWDKTAWGRLRSFLYYV